MVNREQGEKGNRGNKEEQWGTRGTRGGTVKRGNENKRGTS